MKKYELTKEMQETIAGERVYRIRALINIPFRNIRAGELGGFVSGYENLSQDGACWVDSEAIVVHPALVSADALISDQAKVSGKSHIEGMTEISGSSLIVDSTIRAICKVQDRAVVKNSTLLENVSVKGNSSIEDSLIDGKVNIKNDAKICKSEIVGNRIELMGKALLLRAKIGDADIPTENVLVTGMVIIEKSSVIGEKILLRGNVKLQNRACVNGENVVIRDFVQISGNVLIGSNTTVKDLVTIESDKAIISEFGNTTIAGDLLIVL